MKKSCIFDTNMMDMYMCGCMCMISSLSMSEKISVSVNKCPMA
ncbi:MAG: hypothetical protein ACI3W6_02400 [Clostridia bacterium]